MRANCRKGARLTFAALAGIAAAMSDAALAQTAADVCDAITEQLGASSQSIGPRRIRIGADEFQCERKDTAHLWGCTILDEEACNKAGEVAAPPEEQDGRFKQKYEATLTAVTACAPARRYEDLTYRDWPGEKTVFMTLGRRFAPGPQQDQTRAAYVVARAKLFPANDARCSRTSIRVEAGSSGLFNPFLK